VPEFVPGCTFFVAPSLFMHETKPFDSQHIEKYMRHDHHQRCLEILFICCTASFSRNTTPPHSTPFLSGAIQSSLLYIGFLPVFFVVVILV
jgi:hypothetical protein